MTNVLYILICVALIIFFFFKKNNSSAHKKLFNRAILVVLGIIIVIILFIKYYNRRLPIVFKFEKIENDGIVISSNENLAIFGQKEDVVRYTLICPISNSDMTFSKNDGSDKNITIESELDFDYSNKNLGKTLIVSKKENRFFYKSGITIFRKDELYIQNSLTDEETIYLIKKKGDSIECNIAVMYYFFPLPKYSKKFSIPSSALINYLQNKN